MYCLKAKTGRLIWRKSLGPRDWRIPGNGRMISLWPVRTGLVVNNGIIYATAGLYPSQGVYAAALNVSDGSVVWRQILCFLVANFTTNAHGSIYRPNAQILIFLITFLCYHHVSFITWLHDCRICAALSCNMYSLNSYFLNFIY